MSNQAQNEEFFEEHALQNCAPDDIEERQRPLTDEEQLDYAGSIAADTLSRPLTEVSLMTALVRAYKHTLRYCPSMKKWLAYRRPIWVPIDGPAVAFRAVSTFSEQVIAHAQHAIDELNAELAHFRSQRVLRTAPEVVTVVAQRRDLVGRVAFLRKYTGYNALKNAVSLLTVTEEIITYVSQLDRKTRLVNLANYAYDLKTGTPRMHSPSDMQTYATTTLYDPRATCPRFVEFVDWAMSGDKATAQSLQAFLGSCLVGNNNAHVFAVWVGSGANGKSVLQKIMQRVLGTYTYQLRSDSLKRTLAAPGSARSDLAGMLGRRMVFVPEVPEQELDTELIKTLSGDDTFTIRRLYQEDSAVPVTFKLILTTNHSPSLNDFSKGTWRRLRLFAFANEAKTINPKLADEIVDAEGPGIFNWLLEGYRLYQQAPLLPATSHQIEYQADLERDSSPMAAFIADQLVEAPDKTTYCADIHHAYSKWAKAQYKRGEPMRAIAAVEFYRKLRQRYYGRFSRVSGGLVLKGYKLRGRAMTESKDE